MSPSARAESDPRRCACGNRTIPGERLASVFRSTCAPPFAALRGPGEREPTSKGDRCISPSNKSRLAAARGPSRSPRGEARLKAFLVNRAKRPFDCEMQERFLSRRRRPLARAPIACVTPCGFEQRSFANQFPRFSCSGMTDRGSISSCLHACVCSPPSVNVARSIP